MIGSSAKPIQIIEPIDHSFRLKSDVLQSILDHNDIKNRHVVIISIAGALRQGKSFLLNFFLKYLYSQYKKHNVSDWLGENVTNEFSGFKWRAGRERETLGIWIWSEIFTHDFKLGEKVAIILMDTQGIFDKYSSVRDCTTICALSMLLSSVQCYNVMQNINDDDLQHLELFTEYGRLALNQTNKNPFQKLVFVVRDWSYPFETDYGWDGQAVIDDLLARNNDQTPEMRHLRERIQSSFKEIKAFLMPHPGPIVAQGNTFNGDLTQISPEFIENVKKLVTGLCAPENLTVKKIGGHKIRAKDLTKYLQIFATIFNGDALPEPKRASETFVEMFYNTACSDCINHYSDAMQTLLASISPYCTQKQLMKFHLKVRDESMAKFMEQPQLGSKEIASENQQKFEKCVEEKFLLICSENDKMRQQFIDQANLHNRSLCDEMISRVKSKLFTEIEHLHADASHSKFNGLMKSEKKAALQEFDATKVGDDEISLPFRVQFDEELNQFQSLLNQTFDAFNDCPKEYKHKMQESLNAEEYLSALDFLNCHQSIKNEVITEFQAKQLDSDELRFKFQPKIESNIEALKRQFEEQNQMKRHNFQVKVEAVSETLRKEIRTTFKKEIRSINADAYLTDEAFINLFLTEKRSALETFQSKKTADDEISTQVYHSYRERLERDLDEMQLKLKKANQRNKPSEQNSLLRRMFQCIYGKRTQNDSNNMLYSLREFVNDIKDNNEETPVLRGQLKVAI